MPDIALLLPFVHCHLAGLVPKDSVLQEAWDCQLEQALASHVDHGEHNRQDNYETSDEGKNSAVGGLLYGCEYALIGEDRKDNEEIEGFEALLCMKAKWCQRQSRSSDLTCPTS